ncbi:MAG: hypothetical protein AB8H79_25110 [Myxococcota bacterium]
MATLYTVLSWFMLMFGGSTVCDEGTGQVDFNPVPTSCGMDAEDLRDLDGNDESPPPFELFDSISNGF